MSRSLPVLSIFDRYLLREFLRFFFLAFVGFVGFVVLFDAFEKISTFIDHKATAGQVFRYYFNATPYKAVLVTPIALLLATFLSLGYMTRFHEITIMRSSGISLYRILMPVYVVGLLVAATSFLVSDFIMPGAQTRAREILQQEIRGRTSKNLGSRMNVSYIGQDNRFYLIRRYDVPRSAMVDVVIQEFDGDTLTRRIDASKASYEDGAWVLENGVDRSFSGENGDELLNSFETLRLEVPEKPDDFAKNEVRPEQMSFPDLAKYVERVRQSGSRVEQYETDLHLRVSFPLVNFVILLIGSSLAVKMRRGGIALGFGFSLAIAFTYWSILRAGQVLGHSGALPPMLAAWLGNILFIGVGLWMLRQTPK